jgi:hypothetical protein
MEDWETEYRSMVEGCDYDGGILWRMEVYHESLK